MNFFIVHGTGGSRTGNWFPWLKEALEDLGQTVFLPQFPTPEGQSFEAWRAVFLETLGQTSPSQTVLIGHSIGAAFVLRMAEETTEPYAGLFGIAPFVHVLGFPDFDVLNESFVAHPFDWPRIRANALCRVCFAGDDDPYVPLAFSLEVAEKMDADRHIIEKGGHLNAEFGYLSFPALLAQVKKKALITGR